MRRQTVLIALESATFELVKKLMDAGKLPNIAKLAREGMCEKALGVLPSHPPTGYATIATGAYPGTHGITCTMVHNPGEPMFEFHHGNFTDSVLAETLWEAADKAGQRTVVLNYHTGTWPPKNARNGVAVQPITLAKTPTYQTEPPNLEDTPLKNLAAITQIELQPAQGWVNIERCGSGPLEMSQPILLEAESGEHADVLCQGLFGNVRPLKNKWQATVTYHVLITKSGGEGYDRVLICRAKDGSSAVCTLEPGKWGPWVTTEFNTGKGLAEGMNRYKVLTLTRDGKAFRIIGSGITQTSPGGWSYPESIGTELVKEIGPPPSEIRCMTRTDFNPRTLYTLQPWLPLETYVEDFTVQCQWLKNAALHLLKTAQPDLLALAYRPTDMVEHIAWPFIDPGCPGYNSEEAVIWWGILERLYQQVDDLVGSLRAAVGKDGIVALASTHGKTSPPLMQRVYVQNILARAGLLSFSVNPRTNGVEIDWSKTKAVQARSIHIYVNLKGRDPDGIVAPGEEYESVRDQIINAFHAVRDPKTGKCPFTLALRKEDAAILGLHGDRVGDVVFALADGYHPVTHPVMGEGGGPTPDLQVTSYLCKSGIHGWQLPTTSYGIGSMGCLLVMAGGGIKEGARCKPPVHLVDLAPTLAHAAGLPCPAQAEGRVLQEIVE